MRPIHVADLDKARPVLILTREPARGVLTRITVAPITSRARGVVTEVPVGPRNGLDQASVVNCDNIRTVPSDRIGKRIGSLLPEQEEALTEAIMAAFDLE